jgi:hypothetical protein
LFPFRLPAGLSCRVGSKGLMGSNLTQTSSQKHHCQAFSMVTCAFVLHSQFCICVLHGFDAIANAGYASMQPRACNYVESQQLGICTKSTTTGCATDALSYTMSLSLLVNQHVSGIVSLKVGPD